MAAEGEAVAEVMAAEAQVMAVEEEVEVMEGAATWAEGSMGGRAGSVRAPPTLPRCRGPGSGSLMRTAGPVIPSPVVPSPVIPDPITHHFRAIPTR
jgi:hypothetical protein